MTRPWLIAALFWGFVAALYSAQLWVMTRQPGETIPFQPALIVNLAYYLCWIPLTPPVWRIARGWAPGSMRAAGLIARHLSLAAAVVVAHTVVSLLITGYFMPRLLTWAMFAGQLRGRIVSGLLVYAAIAGAGLALSYHARWRERDVAAAQLEAQLSAARLQSLKAQLHPHFLFNSLHAVASLIRTGDNAGAVRTIAGLSDLLRRVLDADAQPWTSLREEAGFIERYFEIQRVRFGDRLRTSIDLAPGTEDIQVPTMILQPLVENAFRHGLADRVEDGSIAVRSTLLPDGRLAIVVEDDGEGLPEGWTMAAANGVGLSATQARLELIYPATHDFRVEPRQGGGTSATIVIQPFQFKAFA